MILFKQVNTPISFTIKSKVLLIAQNLSPAYCLASLPAFLSLTQYCPAIPASWFFLGPLQSTPTLGSLHLLFILPGPPCPPQPHDQWKVEVKLLSRVRLFVTPWTVAHQAPPSMGFPRQEYWSGLPFPLPGDLPDPGIKPRSPALQADSLLSEPQEKSHY